MQHDFPLYIAPVRGAKQPEMRVADRMERPFDLALPEFDEMVQHRKFGRKIIILLDEKLEKMRVIRHVIEHLGGGQAVTGKLQFKSRFRFQSGRRHGDFPFFVKSLIARPLILR
ncbi:hypothetical protein C038_01657 [Brucella sp. 63/311]|nr:hypothetical protein C038_01657 [Brucella sp. 63/311]